MARIELNTLRKEFGETTALDGITLSVADGEFLVLVGPSGCGKSTLLRTISGLETQTAGDISVDGEIVNTTPPKERGVAMVFQNYALYPHMSARRNMTFGLGSHGSFTDDEIAQMVSEVAATLGIGELLDRRPGELSGGEKQRVAMGRALLREPELFLLDEPLSNLDAKLRDEMRTELTHLHDEIDATTLYVTHDQTEALTLGDRVAVMNNGQIEQVDPPQQLYDVPASQFVAEFIGSPQMNLFEGDVTATNGRLHVECGRFSTAVPGNPQAVDGGRFTVGVRPEDLYLADEAAGQQYSDPCELRVELSETLGDSVVLYATDGETTFRVRTGARQQFGTGDVVSVVADPERLHLFDTDSGVAVYHSGTGPPAARAVTRE
jgi:multiple sugar transport system ATP-binding protein